MHHERYEWFGDRQSAQPVGTPWYVALAHRYRRPPRRRRRGRRRCTASRGSAERRHRRVLDLDRPAERSRGDRQQPVTPVCRSCWS